MDSQKFVFGFLYCSLLLLSAWGMMSEQIMSDTFMIICYGTNQQFEIGFAWLMDTCKSYHLHFAYFFGILAFIQIFCYYTSFKRQSFLLPYLGLMLFVSNEWFFWVNGIRQATAMCIWLLSLECFNRRKYVWMVVFMALAITFHKSAVILVVLYPLLFLRKDYFSNNKGASDYFYIRVCRTDVVGVCVFENRTTY